MIFIQFYLNHDESAGIVRCGVHILFVFLSPTQLSSALGIWMSSTDEYKSVICQKHALRSSPRSVMMAQPHP